VLSAASASVENAAICSVLRLPKTVVVNAATCVVSSPPI
jgi:hypothetical protein